MPWADQTPRDPRYKNRSSEEASKRYYRNRDKRKAQSREWWHALGSDKKYAAGLRSRYGLSYEQYLKLLDEQDGKCGLADCPHEAPTPGNPLQVDHDHETGRVRGVICFRCNVSLGRYEKAQKRAVAFAKYLAGKEN